MDLRAVAETCGFAPGGVSAAAVDAVQATMEPMTLVQSRPIRRVKPTAPQPVRPIALTALFAALWTAGTGVLVGCAVAVLGWFAADTGSFGGSVRVGALGWLVAQGSGLEVGGVAVTAVPLGGCLIAGLLLYRGGRWAGATSAVPSPATAALGTLAMSAAYAAVGALVWVGTRAVGAGVSPLRAVGVLALLAACFGGWGIVRGADLADDILDLLPPQARAVLTGAVAGALTMLGVGAVLFTASITRHFGEAVTLAEGLHAGVFGGVVIALIGIGVAPNAILCAGAFAAGPGFVLGTGTTVAPGGVELGPLPALPVFAAVPRAGGAWWQEALVVLPVLAGAVAGALALRRCDAPGWLAGCRTAGLAGLLGGTAYGAAGWLATGAIGPGRMSEVGPDVLPLVLICAVACTLGAVMAAVVRQTLADVAPPFGGRWLPRLRGTDADD